MPTLRRILKYTPAVVLGLLVAWCFWSHYVWIQYERAYWAVGSANATVALVYASNGTVATIPGWKLRRTQPSSRLPLGSIGFYRYNASNAVAIDAFAPIPLLGTVLLPLAVGPFISFRFRLWHYLAYTALVAVELSYYLRWQG